MWQDALNGGLELLGTIAVLASAWRVYRDRGARGIHPCHVGYSIALNFWCVYFYHHIDQPISFWCGVVFAAAVSLWGWMIWKYRERV